MIVNATCANDVAYFLWTILSSKVSKFGNFVMR